MLADRELATIRAALAYWRDEMTPHGSEAQLPYLDVPSAEPLTAEEIERLRELFSPPNVRYARFIRPRTLRILSDAEARDASLADEPIAVLMGPAR